METNIVDMGANIVAMDVNIFAMDSKFKTSAIKTYLVTAMRASTTNRSKSLFFPLHPSVLEPCFYLSFGEG